MKTPNCKSSLPFTVVVLVLFAMFSSACGVHFHDLGTVNQVVDISIGKAMINESKPSIEVHGHDFWEELDCDVQRAELHDGFIRFTGTSGQKDGFGQGCSIDVSLSTEDGMLVSRIIALDTPGFSIEDPIVVSLNQDMDSRLHFANFDMTTVVRFLEVEVTEEELRLKVQVTVDF
jgi:hypothetical protein